MSAEETKPVTIHFDYRGQEPVEGKAPELGPGCCQFKSQGVYYKVSNCGNLETCLLVHSQMHGDGQPDYTPGVDCA